MDSGSGMSARLVKALGIEPGEAEMGSLTIEPFGNDFIVRWRGVKRVPREQVLKAMSQSDTDR